MEKNYQCQEILKLKNIHLTDDEKQQFYNKWVSKWLTERVGRGEKMGKRMKERECVRDREKSERERKRERVREYDFKEVSAIRSEEGPKVFKIISFTR